MTRKLSDDAFSYYVSLGPERSYDRVAEHFEVDRRTVTRHAKREDWANRLRKIEEEAQDQVDKKLAEELGEVRERHLKTIKAIMLRSVEALQRYPLNSAMEAARAAAMAIKLERLILGESTERGEMSVPETIRQYMDTLIVVDDDDSD